jgi:hypothetical protein
VELELVGASLVNGFHLVVRNNGAAGVIADVVCTVGARTIGRSVSQSIRTGEQQDVYLSFPGRGTLTCAVGGLSADGSSEVFLSNNRGAYYFP